MAAASQIVGTILSVVVLFKGTLSLLPDAIARDYDGSLTGLGFWIPALVCIGVLSLIFNYTRRPAPSRQDDAL